jgi:lysophospholipase L1-like esterase
MKCKYFSRIILACAFASAMLASVVVAKDTKSNPAAIAASKSQEPWWQQRHESMNARAKKGNVDLIFIGDSITHGWEGDGKDVWKKYYEKRNAVNLGIGGDQTQHVLWRLDNGNIEGISPKLAVIMIGTNNAGGFKPEDTAEGIKAIVEKLRTKLPNTKILLLGIFPRGADNNDPLRKNNTKVNETISKLADCRNVFYLDIGKKFLKDDGTLSKDIMPDLLHLNAKSYETWAEAIEPSVAKLMGETSGVQGRTKRLRQRR